MYQYIFGLAVDYDDSHVVIVSASKGPSTAYTTENAKSFINRRDMDGKKWKAISNGLPETSEGVEKRMQVAQQVHVDKPWTDNLHANLSLN